VHADRFGQVFVGGRIAGDLLTQPGQHFERIQVVNRLQWLGDPGKLQHQQPPAGAQHAAHLGQRDLLVRHVAQTEGHGHDVEVVIGER